MVFAVCINAQLSFKIGIIRSTLASSQPNLLKFDPKITPNFGGIYYRIKAGNTIGLETGLQYQAYTDAFDDYNTKRHYISIPVTLSYKPTSLISPGIGVQMSQTLATNSPSIVIQNKNFDLMLLGKININPFKSFGVEVGYNLGLIPITTYTAISPSGAVFYDVKLSNRYMYLALKYNI